MTETAGGASGGPLGTTGPKRPLGRRLFLGLLGAGALGTIFGQQVQGFVGSLLQPLTDSSGGGIADLIPGADRFRYYSVTGSYPVIKTENYSLSVGGLARRPLTLSYADLLALPRTELVRDFQCVTGWRVPNVYWAGVQPGDVVDLAQPASNARSKAQHQRHRRLAGCPVRHRAHPQMGQFPARRCPHGRHLRP
jgi:hypothetical protein